MRGKNGALGTTNIQLSGTSVIAKDIYKFSWSLGASNSPIQSPQESMAMNMRTPDTPQASLLSSGMDFKVGGTHPSTLLQWQSDPLSPPRAARSRAVLSP